MSVATKLKRASIRELNDRLRTKYEGGRILISCSIQSYGPDFVRRCLHAVSAFDDFSEDNDPHGEHDCALSDYVQDRLLRYIPSICLSQSSRRSYYLSDYHHHAGRRILIFLIRPHVGGFFIHTLNWSGVFSVSLVACTVLY